MICEECGNEYNGDIDLFCPLCRALSSRVEIPMEEYAVEIDDTDQKTLDQLDKLTDVMGAGETGNPSEHQEDTEFVFNE